MTDVVLDQISKVYANGFRAVDGLNLAAPAATYLGLLRTSSGEDVSMKIAAICS